MEPPVLAKMEEFVPGAKLDQVDLNKAEPEVQLQEGEQEIQEEEEPKKLSDNDHPVGEVEINPPKIEVQNKEEVEPVEDEDEAGREMRGEGYTADQLQFLMGLSLVVGFVFMLMVDQCGGGHSHAHISGKQPS